MNILFDFEGKRYRVSMNATTANRIRLPDGRILKIHEWNASFPPQPSNLVVVDNDPNPPAAKATEVDPGTLQMRFAPGVLRMLLNTRSEEERADREGYSYYLGDMDVAQAALAHSLLSASGLDHASPAGYVAFKTAKDRLIAIKVLHRLAPQDLGWKWRVASQKPEDFQGTWAEWMLEQPIDPQYAEGVTAIC